MIVGFAAAAISVIVGLVIGLYSGYFGGWADEILMRVTDFFLVIPTLVFMIVIAAVIGPSLLNVILVIGLLSWPSTARTIRSMVLSIKNWPFIESATINGGKSNYIIFRHIAPNVFPVVFANAVMSVASAIFAQASLVFLGVGDVTDISWGGIIHDAFAFGAVTAGMWWYVIPPGLFIILVILGFTMTGYSLEEMFNPKRRGF
ncbi:ABC-type dipeptide/oligopeptide/nickel transport system, permease component [mine drainage metagenome]|uniref:ABC-type dipeptide/oligopeptide/nickel transport system, permease component n=2 Tax=mine drainage metagenome TaxID=410659 RepID=T0YKK9_9ZZZZ